MRSGEREGGRIGGDEVLVDVMELWDWAREWVNGRRAPTFVEIAGDVERGGTEVFARRGAGILKAERNGYGDVDPGEFARSEGECEARALPICTSLELNEPACRRKRDRAGAGRL